MYLKMWSIKPIESSESIIKFGISDDKNRISHSLFLELLQGNTTFRSFYNEFLISLAFEAFFWENKPLTKSNLGEEYECNVIKSDLLAGKNPDAHTFSSYFKKDKQVVAFPNLGKDALLIAPCPVSENQGYAHIGSFIRNAPESQIQEFWKRTGDEMLNHIGDKPKWLSTSGLGVFWLHVRIDSYPKYYQTEEYKNPEF